MNVSSLALSYGQGSIFGATSASGTQGGGIMPQVAAARLDRQAAQTRTLEDAEMIVSRLAETAVIGESGGLNGQELSRALVDASRWLAESYGEQTGRAFMGIMAGYAGGGTVDETALGKGMLAAVRFMDKNHGIAAGDALAHKLNADLNIQVNDYFDNGLNEKLYTNTVLPSDAGRTISIAVAGIAERFGPEAAASAESLLLDSIKDKGLTKGLREGLTEMLDRLEEQLAHEPGASGDLQKVSTAGLDGLFGQAVAASNAALDLPRGSLLNVAV